MNKPGEYVLHEATQEQLSSIDNELYLEIKRFRDDTVAAVEKAHAERNCGNCRNWPHERIETIWEENSHCEVTGLFFEDSDAEEKYLKILKCNEWKPKEADNANA